ncbi:MAG: hypothetical protein ABIY70_13580 [Capsulimonas sp.]|uniref:hypothetical protein n=1 Tax=Capsulimonas sp. TaxID=2494211 RepID=UPI0032668BC7
MADLNDPRQPSQRPPLPSLNPQTPQRPPLAPLHNGNNASSYDQTQPYVSAYSAVAYWLAIASVIMPFLGPVAWYLGKRGLGQIYRGESDVRETWSAKRACFLGMITTIIFVVGLFGTIIHFAALRMTVPSISATPPPVANGMPMVFPPGTTPPPGFDRYNRPLPPRFDKNGHLLPPPGWQPTNHH